MKRKQRFLSVLLTLCLMLTFVPSIVFAAEGTGGEASADGIEYATLKEALEAGGNVELLRDVEVDSIITINKPTVFDLGDFTITNNVQGDRPFHVDTDSFSVNAEKGGMIIPEDNEASYGFIRVISVSEFSLNGGTYTGNTDNGAFFRFHEGANAADIIINNVTATTNAEVFYTADTLDTVSVQVTGGTYTVGTRAFLIDVIDCEDSPIEFNGVTITADCGPCIELSGGNSVFTDCNFNVTGNFTGGYTWSRAAIGIGYEGNVTVKSGTYTAKGQMMGANEGYGVYIYTSGGTLNVEGGTFAGTTASLRADVDKNAYGSPATINVYGGSFDGDILATTNTGLESVVIEGGEFTGITEKTLAEGNNLSVAGGSFDNSMKNFTVSKLKFERNINGEYTYYETLQDAVKDAGDDTVITTINNPAPDEDAYTALLAYNDGTNKTIQVVADAEGKITLPSIERSGHIFLGWDDGSGEPIAAGQVYTLTENKTLTAQWKELTKIKTEAKEPTCNEAGNIAYWYCPELDSYFSDEALTEVIDLEDTILPATGKHTFKDGKCTVCGTADPDYTPEVEPKPEPEPTPGPDPEPELEPDDNQSTDIPQNGDNSNMMILVAVMLLAGAVAAGTVVCGKKQKRSR